MTRITMKEVRDEVREFAQYFTTELRWAYYADLNHNLMFARHERVELGGVDLEQLLKADKGKCAGTDVFAYMELSQIAQVNNITLYDISAEANYSAIVDAYYSELFDAGILFQISGDFGDWLGVRLTGRIPAELREYYLDFLRTVEGLMHDYPILDADRFESVRADHECIYMKDAGIYELRRALVALEYDIIEWEVRTDSDFYADNNLILNAYYEILAEHDKCIEVYNNGDVIVPMNADMLTELAERLGIYTLSQTSEGNED